MYKYERTTLVKNFREFNFVKLWPIRNLFNDEIFLIYGIREAIVHCNKHKEIDDSEAFDI